MKKLADYLPDHVRWSIEAKNWPALCEAIEQYIDDRMREVEKQECWRFWNEAYTK